MDEAKTDDDGIPVAEPLHPPVDDVRCWVFSLAAAERIAPEAQRVLSVAELARAARYGRPELRARYVTGRGILRRLLGELIGLPPERVVLRRGRRGRPELDGGAALDFNVSHTRDLAIVGVVSRGRIGVDIEHEDRPTNADGLARKFLTGRERALIADLEPDARRRRFLRLWTCKEAMSKATGDALSAPFRELDVELGDAPRLVDGPEPYRPQAWRLFQVASRPGFIATVALWDGDKQHN